MAIPVRQMLVNSKKFNIKCPYDMKAEYLTVHNTLNNASANNEIQYMINNTNEVSYHFAVDDKEVVQGLLLDRNGWHCGDGKNGPGNRKSIGVEICYSKSGGDRYKKAEALAAKFIAQLLHERKWGIEKVKKHQDWSGKYCPHRILDEKRWDAFKKEIADELSRFNNPKPVEVAVEEPKREKEVDWMSQPFKSNVSEINNAVARVLGRFEKKDPALSDMWREKFLKGELTGRDALGLLYVAVDRGYIQGIPKE